jgi:hypothetical protein
MAMVSASTVNKALEESQLDRRVVEYLRVRFAEVADFMRNQVEH